MHSLGHRLSLNNGNVFVAQQSQHAHEAHLQHPTGSNALHAPEWATPGLTKDLVQSPGCVPDLSLQKEALRFL